MDKKVYLIGKIGDGMFADEASFYSNDYQGRVLSGFFDNSMIKEGNLEVEVLSDNSDLALIRPVNGREFFDHRAATVNKSQLKCF
ncbi:MAG: hypothetical protein Q8N99_00905 [Nanoarchaeota archaeon]|nr:hypothetical protein [Nanoarchaeota archaeon]